MRMYNSTTARIGLVMLLVIVSHQNVWAQTEPFSTATLVDTVTLADGATIPDVPLFETAPLDAQMNLTFPRSRWAASPVQMSGYVIFVALQGLDVASTLHALRQPGTHEANPLFAGVVDSPAKFIALKAATTVATLMFMQHFSKNHPKAAVFVMAGINSGYGFVVNSNLRRAAGR